MATRKKKKAATRSRKPKHAEPSTESAIELEILKILGDSFEGQKEKESDAKYIKRLITAASKLDDDTWDQLSDEAAEWVNDSVEDIRDNGAKIDSFPDLEPEDEEYDDEDEDDDEDYEDEEDEDDDEDYEDEEDEEEDEEWEDEDDDEDEEDAPKKTRKRGSKTDSASSQFVDLIIANHTASKDDIMELLEEAGIEMAKSTAQVTYYTTTTVIQKLKEAGMLVEEEKPAKKAPRKKAAKKTAKKARRSRK